MEKNETDSIENMTETEKKLLNNRKEVEIKKSSEIITDAKKENKIPTESLSKVDKNNYYVYKIIGVVVLLFLIVLLIARHKYKLLKLLNIRRI